MKPPEKRQFRPLPVGRLVKEVAAPIYAAKGFAQGKLMAEWPKAVGDELASQCWPCKLHISKDQGTLHLKVQPGFAAEIQHLAPLLIERANRFIGQPLVNRLKLIQADSSTLPTHHAIKPRKSELSPKAAEAIDSIKDDTLRLALRNFL